MTYPRRKNSPIGRKCKWDRAAQLTAFERLLDIMDELREKCPWDRKQTFETLRHLTIEETYELGDAILKDNLEEIKKSWEIFCSILFFIPK